MSYIRSVKLLDNSNNIVNPVTSEDLASLLAAVNKTIPFTSVTPIEIVFDAENLIVVIGSGLSSCRAIFIFTDPDNSSEVYFGPSVPDMQTYPVSNTPAGLLQSISVPTDFSLKGSIGDKVTVWIFT